MVSINRRTFLQISVGSVSVSLLSHCQPANVIPSLRFAVASDGHLGEPDTPSDTYYTDLLSALGNLHQSSPLDFVVINGDLIHEGNSGLLPNAKAYLDKLPVPYYVTRGNHDQVSVATWQQLWGYSTNHVVALPKATLVLLDTSDETGAYLCGDAVWLRTAMTTVRTGVPVFLFMHIPFIHNAQGTDVCGDIVKVLSDYPSIRAVFHGHDHTKDLGLYYGQAALLFDAHFGSSWGTAYRGYRVVEQHGNDLSTYQYDYVNQKQVNSMTF
jgi:3',5'-cyclic AMP phosphodiesterase CpdA